MTTKPPFDPKKELQAIKDLRAKKRHRRTWGKSKLQPYLGELLALRDAGATFGDLAEWVVQQGKITAHKTAIQRFLQKKGGNHG